MKFIRNYAHESAAVIFANSTYFDLDLSEVSAQYNQAKYANSFAEIRGNGQQGSFTITDSDFQENEVLKGDSTLTLYNMNS